MKSTILVVAVASTLLLSACAPLTRSGGSLPFDRKNPKVYIVKDYIVVDQEPIIFLSGEKGRITWHLQDRDYFFEPTSGISAIKVLSGKHNDIRDCRRDKSDDRVFSCQNDNNGSGTYKYTIVVAHRKSKQQLTLDPTIGND